MTEEINPVTPEITPEVPGESVPDESAPVEVPVAPEAPETPETPAV